MYTYGYETHNWPEGSDEYDSTSASLEQYLQLIEEFPDFCTQEMKTPDGFFPDVRENYIAYAVESLSDKAGPQ